MDGARNNHSEEYNPDSERQMPNVVSYVDGNIESLELCI